MRSARKRIMGQREYFEEDNDITERRSGNSIITVVNAEVLNPSETSDKEMGKKKDGYIANIPNARKSIKRNRRKPTMEGKAQSESLYTELTEECPRLWSQVVKGKNTTPSLTHLDVEEENPEEYIAHGKVRSR